MAELFMVATPIGNLEDITYRAVRILNEVDVIAAEDTRQTGKLLKAYNIEGRMISCRARNEDVSAPGIVKLLEEGKSVAYVSDAGTPGISDPGKIVVSHVRAAGFDIIPVPGASAAAAMISVSGFPGKGFVFEGFLSPKGGKRRKALQLLFDTGKEFIIYESPYRIEKLLTDIEEIEPDCRILLGRELTKKFEEIVEGTASELKLLFSGKNNAKGEFSLLVNPEKKS